MEIVGQKRVRYGQAGYEVRSEKLNLSVEEFPPDQPRQTDGYNSEAQHVSSEERISLVCHEEVQAVKDWRLQGRYKLEFNAEDWVYTIKLGVLY